MSPADDVKPIPAPDRLDTLERALDEAHMKSVLAPRARAHFGDDFEIGSIEIRIHRRHGNRCVLHYRIAGGENGTAREWRVIGKVLAPEAGAATFQHMRGLWAHGFSRDAADEIGIPEPLEFLPSLSMLLQERVPGASVRDLIRESHDPEHFRLVGRALAKLHGCRLDDGAAPRGIDQLLLRCHPRHHFLPIALPEMAEPIETLVKRARAIEQGFGERTFTPVHGDFHLGQVHVDQGRAWLVDFDAFGFGDPASDLGNILVFLQDKIRRDPNVAPLVEVFLATYFERMDPAIAARVPLYEALTHLRRACKQLRLQDDDWRQKIDTMIRRGTAALDEIEGGRRGPDRRNGHAEIAP